MGSSERWCVARIFAANGLPPCSGLVQTTSPTLSDSITRSPLGVETFVPAAKQQGAFSDGRAPPVSCLPVDACCALPGASKKQVQFDLRKDASKMLKECNQNAKKPAKAGAISTQTS